MNDAISFRDNHHLNIHVDEIVSSIPTFSTKKAAIEAGAQYGWRSALRVERRFETVWVVGRKDFQNDNVSGLAFECFRLPLLRWEEINGVTKCPVLKVRKFNKQERAA